MTGLIYVIIIALWAAVLIPIWLRRHDQISEVRSTARFQSAMSTLGRQRTSRSEIVARAQRRRAIVLGVLTLTLATTLALGFLGMAPIWLAFGAAGLVGLYLGAAALTASQRGAARTPHRRVVRVTRASEFLDQDADIVEIVEEMAGAQTPSRKRRFTSLADDEEFAKWNAWDDDDAWEAIPQTLPTYVGAPRASEVPRQIDRDHDGAWTGSDMVRLAQGARHVAAEEIVVDHSATTAEIPIIEPQRAVNE